MIVGFDPRRPPPGRFELDRSHPLAHGLVMDFPWDYQVGRNRQVNLATGGPGGFIDQRTTTPLTADQSSRRTGYGHEKLNSRAETVWLYANPLANLPAISLQLVGRRMQSPAAGTVYVSSRLYHVASADLCSLGYRNEATYGHSLHFRAAKGTESKYWPAWETLGRRQSCVVSYNWLAQPKAWADGNLLAADNAMTLRTIPNRAEPWTRQPDGMGISLFRAWNRQLSDNDAAWASYEPWSVYRLIPRRTYVLFSAAGRICLGAP